MKGTLTKSYNFSSIITPQAIQSIDDIIMSSCQSVRYEIKTTDGTEYVLEKVDEVLNYGNPDSRKIEKITIKGNKEENKSFIYSDFEVLLFDNSQYDKSAIISIRNSEEKDLVFYKQRIKEVIEATKTSYWWIHKFTFYMILSLLVYVGLATLFFMCSDVSDKSYTFLILLNIGLISGFISAYILRKLFGYLFPETIFCIGAQNEFNEKRKRLRKYIFITVILTLILGIASSLIASKIIN